jgi:hypothetical protein
LALRIFCPETLRGIRVPPVVEELLDEELLEELLLEDEELDEELLLEEELDELELEDEELDDELLELEVAPLIVPAEAVSVTRSSLAPSSRRTILKVCVPADRLLKVAGVIVPYPLVCVLFCVVHAPASIR